MGADVPVSLAAREGAFMQALGAEFAMLQGARGATWMRVAAALPMKP